MPDKDIPAPPAPGHLPPPGAADGPPADSTPVDIADAAAPRPVPEDRTTAPTRTTSSVDPTAPSATSATGSTLLAPTAAAPTPPPSETSSAETARDGSPALTASGASAASPWAPGSSVPITKPPAAVPVPQQAGLAAVLATSRPVVPRWKLVARPSGVLPAAAVVGAVGATVIPVDRPGIGWLLAGLTFGGALWAVDRRARRSATPEPAPGTPTPLAADTPASARVTGEKSSRAADPDTSGEHEADARGSKESGGNSGSGTTGSSSDANDTGTGPATDTGTGPATDTGTGPATDTGTGPATGIAAGTGNGNGNGIGSGEAGGNGAGDSGGGDAGTGDTGGRAFDTDATDDVRACAGKGGDAVGGDARESGGGRRRGDTARGADSPSVTGSRVEDRGPAADTNPRTARAASGPHARAVKAQAGTGAATARQLLASARLWWAALALVLLGVGTVRAAGWLFVLCVVSACAAGSLAVLGRRTAHGIFHDVAAVPLAVFGAMPWAFTGWRDAGSTGVSRARRYGTSVLVTAGLLVVFVPLLGGADATFAGLLSALVPEIDGAAAWQWVLMFAVLGLLALSGLYLLAGPPAHAAAPRQARTWSRGEWMLPVGALVVLFAVFVGAQFVALFGGDGYVQRTAGLTYAEYARSGFWQLSAVSVLTLAIIVAVLRWATQDCVADRRALRALLGAAGLLALVIVCSALGRMWTYQQAYGFTVARLLVEMCELWIGVLYVLVLVAVWRLRGRWLPRAAVGTGLATLVVLALLNPERLVAERNIDRWEDGKRLDSHYLSGLSPDVLPALTRLPADLRTGIENDIRSGVGPDAWYEWNWSRGSAR
ncbi:DUF4153 domain-containing protein [Nocardia thailandica]|uniref:DUF4153 domain-containing protein n=1 Tax=Nocardia thailandica TaxID=257275 RepID=UPI000317F6BC|nr:DUF4173 domain-containing protein [Nocardia thailandica]